ncbi:hypothetical protein [Candidatus Regiella endosymbiont of Tuberolachnus salignus]|uniref:hypothetical protein n=1 Tax=Candidatus Regiella endosymbiont of Tuberolachnus salignus TaxID=3077956 RepID=UPI0030CE88A8
MKYGIQIKLDDGTDLVTAITPMFILDCINYEHSGTKTYRVPNGLTLKVMVNACQKNKFGQHYNVTVSGNTVTWREDANDTFFDSHVCGAFIIVYME